MDHLYNHPSLYDADSALFSEQDADYWLKFASSGRILEVGCGTGRLSPLWARAGLEVLALDDSPAMLDFARQRHGTPPGLTWLSGDIRNFENEGLVDQVVLPLNTFHHFLTRDDQLAALTGCRRALKPGGRLGLEIFNVEAWRPYRDWTLSRTVHCNGRDWERWERHRTDGGPVFILELEYRVGGAPPLELGSPLRTLHRHEMQWLLERSGFALERIDGDHRGTIFTGWDPRLLLTARAV